MRRAERHSSGLFDVGACLPGRAQLRACQLISLPGCRHPGCARSPTRGARCGPGWCRTGPRRPRLPVQAWCVDHHPIRATPGYRPARPVACTGRPQPPRRRYRVLTPCAEDAGLRMLPSWCASEVLCFAREEGRRLFWSSTRICSSRLSARSLRFSSRSLGAQRAGSRIPSWSASIRRSRARERRPPPTCAAPTHRQQPCPGTPSRTSSSAEACGSTLPRGIQYPSSSG